MEGGWRQGGCRDTPRESECVRVVVREKSKRPGARRRLPCATPPPSLRTFSSARPLSLSGHAAPPPTFSLSPSLVDTQGIVIDAFGGLRDEKDSAADNLRAFCFVCNLERFVVDQQGIGFDKHVRLEHNPRWSLLPARERGKGGDRG